MGKEMLGWVCNLGLGMDMSMMLGSGVGVCFDGLPWGRVDLWFMLWMSLGILVWMFMLLL